METLRHQGDVEWYYITSADVDEAVGDAFKHLKGKRYFVFPTQPDFKNSYGRVKKELARWENDIQPDILVDHGIVQSIGSLTYGHVETLPKKSEKYLVKLLGLFAIEEYCFCKITPEMALERIRKRNRQSGRGRLDLIKDDEKLVKELTKQDKLFSSISELVPQHTPGKSLVLNMNASESELGNRIIDELLICRI